MSEQDKKSGGGSGGGGSVVMVEKSSSNRHKPYRPTELQDEPAPDLHKRSKAPAVPSVAEELKDTAVSDPPTTVERIECERAMSSEKHMHVPKNISSTGKRRGSSPEEITMVPLDTVKKDIIASPAPIPARVESVVSEVSSIDANEKLEDKRAEDDSITEEITELRTPEAAVKEHSEWPTNSANAKKKEISWKDNEYFDKVRLEDLNAKSQAAILERKPSIGPCFKPRMLYGGPSGINICVPKKSIRTMKEEFNPIQSVIDFNVSKKVGSKSASHVNITPNPKKVSRKSEKEALKEIASESTSHVDNSRNLDKISKKLEKEVLQIETDQQQIKFLGVLRVKLDNMSSKIRNLLNM